MDNSMLIGKSLDKLIALAGGCLVFATGGGTIAAGAAILGTGASLFNAWREDKEKHGPESERILAQVLKKIRDEFDAGETLSEQDEQLLDSADHALDAVLLESIPPPARLVEAFGTKEGFAKTAAVLVLGEVAARDDLFAEAGARAEPLARRFALAAIEAAMETALTNQAYFSRLLPFVLEGIKQDTRETREDVRRLVEMFEASGPGRRALREIGDSRPFVELARRINQGVDDPNQAFAELTAMVELVLEQKAKAKRGTNLGDLIDAALLRISEKSSRGEFDAAAKEAEAAFADWEQREAERRAAELQAGLGLIEANITQNMLRRDPDAVAVWVERKVVQQGDGNSADVYALLEAAGEWQDRGTVKGLNLDLAIAAAVARRALPLCQSPDQRIAALNRLGTALNTLGDRQSGTAQLDEAVAVFRSALQQFVRQDPAREWAIRNNLGQALVSLGSRENGTARLIEAVDTYRAALRGFSREQRPQDWAMTQNNLGCALVRLGERTNGLTSLEEAIMAFQEALKERTPEKNPLDWAETQNNLGSALLRMWEQGGNIGLVLKAATAFFEVGKVLERAEVPLQWADNQLNLGNTLLRIGELEPGGPYLEEAETAYKGALEEWTRERAPIHYAAATLSLAFTIALIAARTRSVIRLDEADALARDAQAIVVQAEHEPYVAFADEVLGTIGCIRREIDSARAPDSA